MIVKYSVAICNILAPVAAYILFCFKKTKWHFAVLGVMILLVVFTLLTLSLAIMRIRKATAGKQKVLNVRAMCFHLSATVLWAISTVPIYCFLISATFSEEKWGVDIVN